MKYKVEINMFGGRNWFIETSEGQWKSIRHNRPDEKFLQASDFKLPTKDIVYDSEIHKNETTLITQAVELTKQKNQRIFKGLNDEPWVPGEIGGNYFVGIEEGVGFKQSDKVSFVGTSGLIGCCALMVTGEVDGEWRVYVTHVNSHLTEDEGKRVDEFKKISTDLEQWFDEHSAITAYLVSNKIEDPSGINQYMGVDEPGSPLFELNKYFGAIEVIEITDGAGTVYIDMTGDKPCFIQDERLLVKNLSQEIGHGQATPPFGHNPHDTYQQQDSPSPRT
jgi:hypothetical protein